MIEVPSSGRLAILTELIDTAMYLDAVLIALYQNDYVPSRDSELADFDIATFTGYVATGVVVWGTPYLDTLGNAQVVGNIHQWNCTGTAVPNVIYGYFAKVGAALKFAERFDQPIPIQSAGQAVVILPRFSFGQ